jgi:hypothetical protein
MEPGKYRLEDECPTEGCGHCWSEKVIFWACDINYSCVNLHKTIIKSNHLLVKPPFWGFHRRTFQDGVRSSWKWLQPIEPRKYKEQPLGGTFGSGQTLAWMFWKIRIWIPSGKLT